MSFTFWVLIGVAALACTVSLLAAWQSVACAMRARSASSSIVEARRALDALQLRVSELDTLYRQTFDSLRRLQARVGMRQLREERAQVPARPETKAELRARLGLNTAAGAQRFHARPDNTVGVAEDTGN